MKRIDTTPRAANLFGAGKDGFQDSNPGIGQQATPLNAAFWNMIQESVARFIEGAGVALDAANYDQITQALAVILQNQPMTVAADTGAANAYVMTLAPAITAYAAGQRFAFLAAHGNTGASTLNVNGKGVKSITRPDGTALIQGDIVAGEMVTVAYDGGAFQLLSGNLGSAGSPIAIKSVNVPYNVIASDAGKVLLASGGAGTVTIPNNILAAGQAVTIMPGVSSDVITVATGAAGFAYGGSSKGAIALKNNESVTVVSQGGSGNPLVISGGLRSSDDFKNSPGSNGYQAIAGASFIQMGQIASSGSADVAVTFPIAFGGTNIQVVAIIDSGSVGYACAVNTVVATGFNLGTYSSASVRAPVGTVHWIAFGFQ